MRTFFKQLVWSYWPCECATDVYTFFPAPPLARIKKGVFPLLTPPHNTILRHCWVKTTMCIYSAMSYATLGSRRNHDRQWHGTSTSPRTKSAISFMKLCQVLYLPKITITLLLMLTLMPSFIYISISVPYISQSLSKFHTFKPLIY